MRRSLSGVYRALRSAIPWLALGVALALTAATWLGMERSRTAHARSHFDLATDVATEKLALRLAAYEDVLRAAAAHAAVDPEAAERWHAFVGDLELPERFPAMSDVEYVAAPVALHDGDRVRAATAARAVASREAAISAGLPAPDAAEQPSIALYYPVEDANALVAATAPIEGFVVGIVRIYDLTHGVLDGGVMDAIDTRIYDGPQPAPDRVLVDTRTAGGEAAPLFERVDALPLPGRTWTVQFLSRPDLDAAVARDRPFGLLAAGLAASLLVFLLARSVMRYLDRAQQLSMRDPLTGLYNRRYLESSMDRELHRAWRARGTIGVIMLDVDHFKRLNDSCGHDAGDFVLLKTAEMLTHATRGSDIACRFGGEEFALILPGASLEVARERAESIRASFAAARFEFNGKALEPMTLSAGVAALGTADLDWSQALHQADRALYTAKQAGRNRVLAVARE